MFPAAWGAVSACSSKFDNVDSDMFIGCSLIIFVQPALLWQRAGGRREKRSSV
jgi:hypothetical protein